MVCAQTHTHTRFVLSSQRTETKLVCLGDEGCSLSTSPTTSSQFFDCLFSQLVMLCFFFFLCLVSGLHWHPPVFCSPLWWKGDGVGLCFCFFGLLVSLCCCLLQLFVVCSALSLLLGLLCVLCVCSHHLSRLFCVIILLLSVCELSFEQYNKHREERDR